MGAQYGWYDSLACIKRALLTSTGGLTLKYALDGVSRQQLSGVIASAPLIGIPAEGAPNSIMLKIGSLAAHLVPDQIIPVEVPVKTCTRDPEFLKKGEADELLRPFGSLKGGMSEIYCLIETGLICQCPT